MPALRIRPATPRRRPVPEPPPQRGTRGPGVPPRVRIRAPRGVYGPTHDSRLLAEELAGETLAGARVLDLCTGSGILAVTAAALGADVTAVDIEPRAARAARANLRRNGVAGRVACGDLFAAIPDGPYDVVVSNPPYVPSEDEGLPSGGTARAWDAGRDGRVVLDRICAEAPRVLVPGGRLLLVHSHVTGVERTVECLREQGMAVEVAAERRIPFGPVMRGRAAFLHGDGHIAADETHERIVVVRAVAGR